MKTTHASCPTKTSAQSAYLSLNRNRCLQSYRTLLTKNNFYLEVKMLPRSNITKTPKSKNNTNKLTNQGSGRPTTSMFCEVKYCFLSKESLKMVLKRTELLDDIKSQIHIMAYSHAVLLFICKQSNM